MNGIFFLSLSKGWDKLFTTWRESTGMGFCLVSSNLPEGHHMNSGSSIHCAWDIYCVFSSFPCQPVWFCTGCCSIRVCGSGSRGDFWQLQSEAASRLHCWSRLVLDGLGSAPQLPPQLKTHLCSSKKKKMKKNPGYSFKIEVKMQM